jgi:hypothetical protein
MEQAEKEGFRFEGEMKVCLGDEITKSDRIAKDDVWDKIIVRNVKDLAFSLFLGLTPFAIVGALSRFESRQSTPMERGFTIS